MRAQVPFGVRCAPFAPRSPQEVRGLGCRVQGFGLGNGKEIGKYHTHIGLRGPLPPLSDVPLLLGGGGLRPIFRVYLRLKLWAPSMGLSPWAPYIPTIYAVRTLV